MAVTDKPQLTKSAYDRLRGELEELTTKGRRDMAERLQRARELGDLSENAEYHETKNQQALMEAKIRKIEATLRDAEIIQTPTESEVAVAGTVVTLKPVDGGDVERYLLAASSEERAEGVRTLTTSSPLGKAITGKAPGDTVHYEAPGGTFSYEVVDLAAWDGTS